jgi:hypothetical protein
MAVKRIRRGKGGFTLIEAILVLAITSLTIGVIFTIGARGGSTVLRLGNRALDVADTQLARDTFRSVVDSLVVPAMTTRAQSEGGLEADAEDTSLTGDPTQLSAQWLAKRTTACGAAGAAGRLTLALTNSAGRTVLSCQVDEAEPVTLIDLGERPVRFQYSEDGTTWVDEWIVEAGQPVMDAAEPNAELRRVYVRLVSNDGLADLLALASSGRALNPGIPF